ncbi:MAG: hypothetical protein A2445_04235 [Candidatus Jacksonbacteria bacterium RIFOXYC2_FULL_44_29]|nr:MAG: Prephenate dehydratase / chorismate mutase [Parcubacteria group bacterium GW2011_GWA2_42_28]KKT56202.1 MAG: Prephenate dehydratase / chorismate mutase [Parcubacteria group bacterium GW2011_GWC2_44_22]OGY76146.1 MAG: hypothetical protein A2240_00455 [Candidatus Jacksonbacteria bacterium RIFOXYA2_FULL_43_12]OGY77736.1 MAG: hypothetical protein A2295_02955 [Candidatus Jacksonbacteria bacterium RIFOXYB2_FULL_44_15]OGY78873.1 MAG: hypothetical protein A2550_05020 [Candidatus Jacksonbacteria 
MQVYYLGPGASFTHQAGLQFFAPSQLISENNIEEVLEAVQANPGNLGIVPVENSLEGMVIRTLDFILEKKLKVIAELNLPVIQNLLSKETSLDKIKVIYSHPHALAQTSKWLKTNLPGVAQRETGSTSQAVVIATHEPKSAAIASSAAAKIYGLSIMAKNISNSKNNLTRFWVVGQNQASMHGIAPYALPTKTSLYLVIHDRVGALQHLLEAFAENAISLTSIQSRPLLHQPWKYGFFIDLLVDAADPLAKKLFNRLKKIHPQVTVLGSYPQLGTYNRQAIITYNVKRIEQIFKANQQHPLVRAQLELLKKQILRQPASSPATKKILLTRALLIPAVALYKFNHQQQILDQSREATLLAKIKPFSGLVKPYQQMFKMSRQLQAIVIKLLKNKEVSVRDLANYNIDDLRYYIDYLDTLAITLAPQKKYEKSNTNN